MAFEPCKNCGHDIGCGCEYRVVHGIECCDFCYHLIQEPQKINEEIYVEQSIDSIPVRDDSQDNDEES